jgi:alpha-1,2-mannosyltransferase
VPDARLRIYPWLFIAGYVVIGSFLILGGPGRLDRQGKPVGGDFVAYYAAASLVKEGRALAPYDTAELHRREQEVIGAPVPLTPFFYPPPVLLALVPLALPPFWLALALWVASSIIAYAVVIRRHSGVEAAPRSPLHASGEGQGEAAALFPAALAFPGLFQNIIQGQNGCLTLAIVGVGLSLLATRPFVAGLVLGLLFYKPQLAPLVLVALIAGRKWRALVGALASTTAAVGVSIAAFGPEAWRKFFSAARLAADLALSGELPWIKMTSLAAAVRLLGGGPVLAMVVQGVAILIAAVTVGRVWATRPIDRTSHAALVLAMLVAAPFAYDYDLTLLALPLLWLYLETGTNRGLLAVGWLTPLLSPVIAAVTHISLAPISLAALLIESVRRKETKKLATPSGP